MPLYARDSRLAKPDPVWLQEARARERAYPVTGPHPRPEPTPEPEPVLDVWHEVSVDDLAGSPRAFADAARAAGHEVAARQAGTTVQVAVRSPRIKVAWSNGRYFAGAMPDGAANVGIATYALTMPLDEARARAAADSAERAAARAAKKESS